MVTMRFYSRGRSLDHKNYRYNICGRSLDHKNYRYNIRIRKSNGDLRNVRSVVVDQYGVVRSFEGVDG